MAQSEGPSMSTDFYGLINTSTRGEMMVTAPTSNPLQSGSSDTDPVRPGTSHALPFKGDYGNLANPG
jgi:hypothetical protein